MPILRTSDWNEIYELVEVKKTMKLLDVTYVVEKGDPKDPDNWPVKCIASLSPIYVECPIHGCKMQYFEKNGDTWYAHYRKEASYWCHGERTPYTADNGASSQCQIHGVAMKMFSRNGRTWYSHCLSNGQWCHGMAKESGYGQ